MMRKVISLMEKDASRSQIRDMDIREGFIIGRLHVENATRVIVEFVVLRLEMFSQSVVRHRQSESRLTVAIRVTS